MQPIVKIKRGSMDLNELDLRWHITKEDVEDIEIGLILSDFPVRYD